MRESFSKFLGWRVRPKEHAQEGKNSPLATNARQERKYKKYKKGNLYVKRMMQRGKGGE